MKYKCIVSKKGIKIQKRVKHVAENYKILKQTFFKSVCRYDIIHICIEYESICWYI